MKKNGLSRAGQVYVSQIQSGVISEEAALAEKAAPTRLSVGKFVVHFLD